MEFKYKLIFLGQHECIEKPKNNDKCIEIYINLATGKMEAYEVKDCFFEAKKIVKCPYCLKKLVNNKLILMKGVS